MKKLFIYFSLSNNGDIIAKEFKNKGYEIRKVVSKSKYPKNKFVLMMIGGYKSSFNKKDKLINFDNNVSSYDKIVIGSPIWNDRISAPINGVLDSVNLNNKNVEFVLYSASGEANNAKDKIKAVYNKDAIILKEPKKNKKELSKLKEIM